MDANISQAIESGQPESGKEINNSWFDAVEKLFLYRVPIQRPSRGLRILLNHE